jgi:hypothetical protein
LEAIKLIPKSLFIIFQEELKKDIEGSYNNFEEINKYIENHKVLISLTKEPS